MDGNTGPAGRHRAPRGTGAPRVPLAVGGLAAMAVGAVVAVLAIGAPFLTAGVVLLLGGTLAVIARRRRRRTGSVLLVRSLLSREEPAPQE